MGHRAFLRAGCINKFPKFPRAPFSLVVPHDAPTCPILTGQGISACTSPAPLQWPQCPRSTRRWPVA
eukprot:970923-Prymnesium_polylepis.1